MSKWWIIPLVTLGVLVGPFLPWWVLPSLMCIIVLALAFIYSIKDHGPPNE